MTKKHTLLMALALSPLATFGQGFYARLGAGYALPHAGQTLDMNTGYQLSGSINFSTINGASVAAYESKKVSLNTGPVLTVGGGYLFTENVGVDLALSQTLVPGKHSLDLLNYNNAGIPYNITITTKALSPTFLTPSLLLQGGGKTLGAYARVGVAVPLIADYQQDQYFTNLPGIGRVSTTTVTYQFHNSFSLGLAAAAGISYKAGNSRLWAEASFLSLSMFTKSSEMTSYVDDGVQYISQIPDSSRNTTYSRSYTARTNRQDVSPSFSMPYSNIGINLGVSFYFGDSSPKAAQAATKKKVYKKRRR